MLNYRRQIIPAYKEAIMKEQSLKYFDEIRARYAEARPKSAAMAREAMRYLPGGDTRTATFYLPYASFMAYGEGAYMYDIDGNKLLDFQGNYTSLIHGHAHPETVKAVQEQIAKGSAYAAPFELQWKLGELLTERYPALDMVRFCNSGTEATMHAVRAARAFTGRDKVIKTEGGYHGTTDIFEASVDPDLAIAGDPDNINVIPESLGVSKNALKDVLVVPFNDIERTRKVIEENASETACMIIEPVMGSAGQITPDPEWLKALRAMTEEHGVLLIFDEVVTGRLSTGGAHKYYGIMPDLISLGKIIGGGIPVGAFGGRRDIMDLYDPRKGKMYHSGTFNGNAITMAAGYATMKAYDFTKVNYINHLGSIFADGLKSIYKDLSINMQVSGVGSIYNTLFTNKEVRNYRDVATAHEELNKILFLDLITKGVFNAERGMFCISTPMTEDDISFCLEKVKESLRDMLPIIAIEAPELL